MTPGCTNREVRMWDEKEAYAGCIHKPITTVDNYVYFYWRLLKDGMQTIIPFTGLSLKYVSSCVISLVSKEAGYGSGTDTFCYTPDGSWLASLPFGSQQFTLFCHLS